MLDTLDLNALRQRIKTEKEAAQRRQQRLAIGGLILLVAIVVVAALMPRLPLQPNVICITADVCFHDYVPYVAIVFIVLIGNGWIFYRNMVKRRLRVNAELAKLPLTPTILQPTKTYYWYYLWLACIFAGVLIFRDAPLLLVIVLIVVPLFVPSIMAMQLGKPIREAFFKGDYGEALRRIKAIQNSWWGQRITLRPMEGSMLLFGGKVDESEALHRELIGQLPNLIGFAPSVLNNYAIGLGCKGRVDEAIPFLEAAARISPQYSNPYDTLAYGYLQEKRDQQRAYELASFAVELSGPPTSKVYTGGIRMLTRAWAEAQLGRAEQAKATVTEAFKTANPEQILYYAELHRLAGEVKLALGDVAAARDHFTTAAEVDPNGLVGMLARESLEALGS